MGQSEKVFRVFRSPRMMNLQFGTYPFLKGVGGGTCSFDMLPDYAGPALQAGYKIDLYTGPYTKDYHPLKPSDVSRAKKALGLE